MPRLMRLRSNLLIVKMFRKAFTLSRNIGLRDTYRVAVGMSVVGAGLSVSQARTFCAAPPVEAKPAFNPTVYQYVICPFCSRVKSYLDFCGVDYNTIEVDPLTKSELKPLTLVNKKVPIAIIKGETVEDSSKIIEVITKMGLNKEIANFPGPEFFPSDTEEWTLWSEKKLAVMLYPNISRNFEESWECFTYVDDVKSWGYFRQQLIHVAGAAAMSMVNGKIKKKYNIVDERKELKETMHIWTQALKGQKFLHGEKPTMPDVMVFGVLKAIKGLRTFNEIMAENAELKIWYDNVEAAIPAKSV